jgi:serine/threonine-protein kinase
VAFSLTLPQGETFVQPSAVALSADGQQIVYGAVRNGQPNLYLRKLNQFDSILLPGTSGARQPIFSPDGESIAFVADGALKVLRLSGGSVRTIASVNRSRGASWGDDDWIVCAPDLVGGLFRVSSRGGKPEQLTEVDATNGGSSHRFPHVLPGAGALVFMISDGQRAGTVSALDLRSRRRVDGLATGYGPHYLRSGHLVFMNTNGQLSLLPFDASNLRTLGPATTLQETGRVGSAGEFQGTAASSGTLAFMPFTLDFRSFVAIADDGKVRPLAIEPRPAGGFRVSPDGQSMVVTVSSGFVASDLWLFEFGRSVWSRLTSDRQSFEALWTPDGRDVVYGSTREGGWSVYRQPANPLSTAGLLFTAPPGMARLSPSSWLADGGLVLTGSRGSSDVLLHESAGRSLRALVETPANEWGAASADGQWIAYASDASGDYEIFVTTIKEPRSTVQVSRSGGRGPIWAKTGNDLYFRRGNQILATTVSTERGILRSSPERLVAAGVFSQALPGRGLFDVMPDGSLIVMKDEPGPPPELRIIVNWASNALRHTK